jgi:hypothetical protein
MLLSIQLINFCNVFPAYKRLEQENLRTINIFIFLHWVQLIPLQLATLEQVGIINYKDLALIVKKITCEWPSIAYGTNGAIKLNAQKVWKFRKHYVTKAVTINTCPIICQLLHRDLYQTRNSPKCIAFVKFNELIL